MMEVKNQSQYIVTDWINYSTNDIFEVITDYVANGSFASLKNNVTYYNDKEYAILIRTKDFNNNFKDNFVYVDKKSYEFLNKSAIYFGDLIISNVGAIGTVFLAPNIDTPMTLGPNAILLRPRKEFHNQYLYFLFISQIGQSQLQKITTVTAQPKFNKTDFKKISILIPPLNEQQKIAEILSTIDEQIEQTDQLIEKTKELKKGLMQQLLTRGIGHTEFKLTELGEIPKSWMMKGLKEISDKSDRYSFTGGPFGSNLTSKEYKITGVQIIQLQNIAEWHFNNSNKVFTSNTKADELSSCNIFPGDIVMAKMADPVARACIVPDRQERYLMSSDAIRLKVDSKMYDTKYIMYSINNDYFRSQAVKNSTGTTRLRIGLKELAKLNILCPPLSEQKEIAGILSSVDEDIEEYQQEKSKYRELKKGLMQQLLTGKTRVKVD